MGSAPDSSWSGGPCSRAALEATFYAGFFNWPRDRTGEEIADSLRISPSTFHQHLRLGERKLMRALFEGARPAD